MTVWLWVGFVVIILALLALDLGVLQRKQHVMGIRESLCWSAFWISLGLLFNLGVYFMYEHHLFGIGEHIGHNTGGRVAAVDFLAGYLIEKSLSLDNIFVIALIFSYFQAPREYEHRVLFWGVLGRVPRGVMIAAGAALIARFEWITYVFGGLLMITAIKMALTRTDSVHPEPTRSYVWPGGSTRSVPGLRVGAFSRGWMGAAPSRPCSWCC